MLDFNVFLFALAGSGNKWFIILAVLTDKNINITGGLFIGLIYSIVFVGLFAVLSVYNPTNHLV